MSIAFGGDGNSRGSSAVSPDRPGRAKGMWLGVDDVVEGALAQAPEVEHATSLSIREVCVFRRVEAFIVCYVATGHAVVPKEDSNSREVFR